MRFHEYSRGSTRRPGLCNERPRHGAEPTKCHALSGDLTRMITTLRSPLRGTSLRGAGFRAAFSTLALAFVLPACGGNESRSGATPSGAGGQLTIPPGGTGLVPPTGGPGPSSGGGAPQNGGGAPSHTAGGGTPNGSAGTPMGTMGSGG